MAIKDATRKVLHSMTILHDIHLEQSVRTHLVVDDA